MVINLGIVDDDVADIEAGGAARHNAVPNKWA
jgi:hypothetical protein